MSIKDYDKAIEDYSKAINLNPKDFSIYKNRAFAYRAIGEIQKAEEDEKKAESLE